MMDLTRLTVSPCSNPELELDAVLERYAALGYTKFEVFTSWAKSAFDYHGDPAFYRTKGEAAGLAFTSFHLPPVGDDIQAGTAEALLAARFAREIGVNVVLFKAKTRAQLIAAGPAILDGCESLGLTAVVQNHVGTAITTLEDYREVLDGVSDDRLKTVLEVGQFCSAGIDWQQAAEELDGTIGLVHIKDQIGDRKVPFGEGDVDFAGLFDRMDRHGYAGDYVVEMEVCRDDTERTIRLLGEAREYLGALCAGT